MVLHFNSKGPSWNCIEPTIRSRMRYPFGPSWWGRLINWSTAYYLHVIIDRGERSHRAGWLPIVVSFLLSLVVNMSSRLSHNFYLLVQRQVIHASPAAVVLRHKTASWRPWWKCAVVRPGESHQPALWTGACRDPPSWTPKSRRPHHFLQFRWSFILRCVHSA